ncbi:MAG: hypothetical protein KatS3mg077_0303 [Candidatus Binatia bacterium]|nr:MAG: hypothetical protein KatS3mg077_0303 [Candidatus Binatia bacterium]
MGSSKSTRDHALVAFRALLNLGAVVRRPSVVNNRSALLSHEQLAVLRASLLQRRSEILADAARTVGGLHASRDNTADPTDRASVEADHIALLRVRDRERKLLAKIDEALARMESGEYGACESCGEPIGFERLQVRPVTTLCIQCKAEQEEMERRPGHS